VDADFVIILWFHIIQGQYMI